MHNVLIICKMSITIIMIMTIVPLSSNELPIINVLVQGLKTNFRGSTGTYKTVHQIQTHKRKGRKKIVTHEIRQ